MYSNVSIDQVKSEIQRLSEREELINSKINDTKSKFSELYAKTSRLKKRWDKDRVIFSEVEKLYENKRFLALKMHMHDFLGICLDRNYEKSRHLSVLDDEALRNVEDTVLYDIFQSMKSVYFKYEEEYKQLEGEIEYKKIVLDKIKDRQLTYEVDLFELSRERDYLHDTIQTLTDEKEAVKLDKEKAIKVLEALKESG